MSLLFNQMDCFSNGPYLVLDHKIRLEEYCLLDLSVTNGDLIGIDLGNPNKCQNYINSVLSLNQSKVAWGGYLEKRNLYSDYCNFSKVQEKRDIHLGIDFWAKEGSQVITPIAGTVHSYANNSNKGDYGPTIVLQHKLNGQVFHSLFGHLSLASIQNLEIGQKFKAGEVIATLGTTDINVNYAPHLHYQIIVDMEGKKGDYPGVCSINNLNFYLKNCPNPNLLLQIPV